VTIDSGIGGLRVARGARPRRAVDERLRARP
jgi:glutamate racemase